MACVGSITSQSHFRKEDPDNGVVEERTSKGYLKFHNAIWEAVRVIHIDRRESQEPGFGTSAHRVAMQASFDRGFEGHMTTEASWSSHIFHLKTGMRPHEKRMIALTYFLGRDGTLDISKDREIFLDTIEQLKAGKGFSQKEMSRIECYKLVLTLKDEKLDFEAADAISDEELIARKDEVLKQTVSFAWERVMSPLLTCIRAAQAGERPTTDGLGAVFMHMSDLGIARWKKDLEGELPFAPFRDFEHLYPSLFPWQVRKLSSALSKARARGVKV
ncbi:MAG: hypothetical protein K2P51_05560 [Rhabdochlamydiaceae bacterium]|nr:hypothetical protein [Rhabdochlamydiaceae bacterium]